MYSDDCKCADCRTIRALQRREPSAELEPSSPAPAITLPDAIATNDDPYSALEPYQLRPLFAELGELADHTVTGLALYRDALERRLAAPLPKRAGAGATHRRAVDTEELENVTRALELARRHSPKRAAISAALAAASSKGPRE